MSCILGHNVVRLLDCRAQIRHLFGRVLHWEVGVVFSTSLLVLHLWYLDGVLLELVGLSLGASFSILSRPAWFGLDQFLGRRPSHVVLVIVTVLRHHA